MFGDTFENGVRLRRIDIVGPLCRERTSLELLKRVLLDPLLVDRKLEGLLGVPRRGSLARL